MSNSRLLSILILMLLMVLLFTRQVTAQTPVEDLIITEIDESNFPQINVRFRVLDGSHRSIPGLLGDSFAISENGEPMSLESLEEVEEGLWLHIVIDAGGGMSSSRWEKTKEALINFVETTPWMRDGHDKIAVTAVEATGTRMLLEYSNDADAIASVIENYQPPGGGEFSNALVAIDNILDAVDLNEEVEGQARAILLFTPGLEKVAGLEALQETVEEYNVPLHAVLVREDERIPCRPPVTNEDGTVTVPACDEGLRDLATNSGGVYAHLVDRNSLNDLYRTVTDQRLQYDLSYRSYLSDSGTRQVRLSMGDNNGAPAAEQSYRIEVNPARVIIEQPREGEVIKRESDQYLEDLSLLPSETYKVIANVVYPDNRRRLLRASLYANDELQSEVNYPGESIELSWDLPAATKTGDTDYSLQVTIEDELGIVSTSPPVISKVRVTTPLPPTPGDSTAAPTSTATDENGGEGNNGDPPPPPPPPPLCFTPEPVCSWIEIPVRQNLVAVISLLVALLALGFAGLVFSNRENMGPLSKSVEWIRDTIRGQRRGDPRAYVKILGGEEEVGKMLPLYGDTRLGRVRGDSDILFHQDGRGSPVSGLHCTLIDKEDGWIIRDEDSTNGTFLDGVELKPMIPDELNDEAIIELAPTHMGGVEIQFLIASEGHERWEDTRRT